MTVGQFINFCAGAGKDTLPILTEPDGAHVNALLLNVFSNFKTERERKKTNELIGDSKAKYFMLDSGGFQLKVAMSEGKKILMDKNQPLEPDHDVINITPEHVVGAAIYVDPQPHILVALDSPVKDIHNFDKNLDIKGQMEREFRSHVGLNVSWGAETARLVKAAKEQGKLSKDLRLLLPVQAYSIEQFSRYIKYLKSEGDIIFDGFSMPLRNLREISFIEIAQFIIEFYKMGVKNFHALGEANFKSISFLAYLSKRPFFDWISADAQTWRQEAEKLKYIYHYNLQSQFIHMDTEISDDIINECPCPWCDGKTFTYIQNLPSLEKTEFLRCHNYFVVKHFAEEIIEKKCNKQLRFPFWEE